MATPQVVRIPRSDEKGSFILVHVSATGSGSRPLNLRLAATDGEAVYVYALRHDRTAKLKEAKSPCSQEEWERIITSILLDQDVLEDVEAAAAVRRDQTITITIRKSIEKITQRLGTLTLNFSDEVIELFDWCNVALEKRCRIKEELAKATARAEELEMAANELKEQLEDFIKAKDADESILLDKFRRLLNEKKVKIREQRRLLASSQGGADQATTAEAERDESPPPRRARPGRSSKRKVAQAVLDDESDDGFEKMDVDGKQEDDQPSEDQQTTEGEATASEADEDEEAPAAQPPKAAPQAGELEKKKVEPPPPRRNLPFGLEKSTGNRRPAAAQDTSDAESDDEL